MKNKKICRAGEVILFCIVPILYIIVLIKFCSYNGDKTSLFTILIAIATTFYSYVIKFWLNIDYYIMKRFSTKFLEDEIVKDAIDLIKSVDKTIKVPEFKIYRNKFSATFFVWDSQEPEIFIGTQVLKTKDKNIIFMAVLHEILHAVHDEAFYEMYKRIYMDNKLHEGINQYLTEWLINNFSTKYKLGKRLYYKKGIKLVKKLLKEKDIKDYDLFMNYVSNIKAEKFFIESFREKYFMNL